MAEQHDTWLKGLGLDITNMLALRPRGKPAATDPPADGELPFGLLDLPDDAGAGADRGSGPLLTRVGSSTRNRQVAALP